MLEAIRAELLDMKAEDLRVRQRLADEGKLSEGYNPEMQSVHERNAARLEEIIAEYGWPTADTVGADGLEAAWLIVQHAIGKPSLQRRVLEYLKATQAPSRQAAYLEDRIAAFEGRPQRYGTQWDWNDAGVMAPLPIEDAEHVDERRAAVGLWSMEENARRMQVEQMKPPADLAAHKAGALLWMKQVGWRS